MILGVNLEVNYSSRYWGMTSWEELGYWWLSGKVMKIIALNFEVVLGIPYQFISLTFPFNVYTKVIYDKEICISLSQKHSANAYKILRDKNAFGYSLINSFLSSFFLFLPLPLFLLSPSPSLFLSLFLLSFLLSLPPCLSLSPKQWSFLPLLNSDPRKWS